MTNCQPLTLAIILILHHHLASAAINKCCDVNQHFVYNAKKQAVCSTNNTVPQAFRFPKHLNGTAMLSDADLANHEIVFGEPHCLHGSRDELYLYRAMDLTEFTLHLEGSEIMLRSLKEDSLHDLDVAHAQWFPPSTYCVDSLRGSGTDYMARLCPCKVIQCVRKCCRNRQGIDDKSNKCASTSHLATNWTEWLPEIRAGQEAEVAYYRLINSRPQCRAAIFWKAKIDQAEENKLFLLKNGDLQTGDKARVFPADEYCTDYSVSNSESVVMYCHRPDVTHVYVLRLTSALYLINALALLVTVLLTLLFPDMRKNLHNKMALAHNIMLLVGFTTTGVAQTQSGTLGHDTCLVFSYVIHYSMIASFFWLSAMCIDITIVFRGFQQVYAQTQTNQRKLLYYSLYAWGATSVITSSMAVADFTTIIPSLKPGFGEAKCFFNNDTAKGVFLYGPMGILLTLNIALFTYTIVKIVRVKRQTAFLNSPNSANTGAATKQTITVFLRLFGLMGVSWISEVISWALDSTGPYWLPLDVLNLSRGLFIFVIFCCTRTVYQLVRNQCVRIANCVGANIKLKTDTESTGTMSSRMEMEAVHKVN